MIWDGAGGWKNSFQMRQDGRKCFCCTWGGSGERQTLVTVPGAPGQTRAGKPPAPVGLTTHPPRPPCSLPAALLTGIPPSSHQRAAVTKLSTKLDLFLLIGG